MTSESVLRRAMADERAGKATGLLPRPGGRLQPGKSPASRDPAPQPTPIQLGFR
jgi:hypothetical protein